MDKSWDLVGKSSIRSQLSSIQGKNLGFPKGIDTFTDRMNKSNKTYYFHILHWCFMTLFVFDYHWYETTWYEALSWSVLEILGYMFLFYANVWQLKRSSGRWLQAAGFSILLIMAYVALIHFSGLESYFYEAGAWRNIFSLILNATLFTGLAYLFFSAEQYTASQQRNLLLENENKQLQIDSLKARINPHFLFNTLNNMNALIVKQDERLPQYLSKLSGVLRYSIDDGAQAQLPLKKEFQYLQDYLDLIRMQEPASDNIDVYIEGESENLYIIPFVLMSLLENAVKHGDLMYNSEGFLHINISTEEAFECEISNSFSLAAANSTGVGLDNIRKQLDLVYGDAYRLESKQNDSTYTTTLRIALSKLQAI